MVSQVIDIFGLFLNIHEKLTFEWFFRSYPNLNERGSAKLYPTENYFQVTFWTFRFPHLDVRPLIRERPWTLVDDHNRMGSSSIYDSCNDFEVSTCYTALHGATSCDATETVLYKTSDFSFLNKAK